MPAEHEVAVARPRPDWKVVRVLLAPRTLHWLSLVGAAVFLLWANRNQWFNSDEWAWIFDRSVVGSSNRSLLEPHNEHWVTIPIIIWRALYAAFGVRTYVPYLLLVVGAHLVTVHLLWRLLLRIRIDPLVATLACIPFAVLGAGWENLLWGFQFSLVMSLALGLGALLVLPDDGPVGRRDTIAVALLVVALMCSGLAATMVMVAGLFVLLTRGVRAATVMVVPPAAVHLVWFAIWGRDPGGLEPEPLTTAVQKLPAFVWTGLTATVDDTSGLAGIGAIVLVLLGVFIVRQGKLGDPAWSLAIASTVGAIAFLTFTGIRRSSLGVETASSSRYVYVVAALLLPVAALAADRLLRGRPLRLELLAIGTALLLLVQVSTLNTEANRTTELEQADKRLILTAAALAHDGADILAGAPAPSRNPDLTMSRLIELDNDDKLPDFTPDLVDRLSALTELQLRWESERRFPAEASEPIVESVTGARTTTGPASDCIEVTPMASAPVVVLHFVEPASVEIVSSGSGAIDAALVDDGARADPSELRPDGGGPVLNAHLEDMSLELTLPSDGTTTICGVTVDDPARIDTPSAL
jgi:hypothetical protein